MSNDALIHLRVPAATKGRWVRASRDAGMRLTDWIVDAVEAHMQRQIAGVTIPDGLDFSALKLVRDNDGSTSFEWGIIERICSASRIPIEWMQESEDNVAGLIMAWYRAHRDRGGSPDPTAEDLIAETIAEERAGQSVSVQPGRA